MTMLTPSIRRAGASFAGAVALAIALSGCVSPEQQRQADLYADQGTCAEMGARYGSSAHTSCMLQQQQRRDEEHTRFMQEAYLASEMARNAQEMRESQRD